MIEIFYDQSEEDFIRATFCRSVGSYRKFQAYDLPINVYNDLQKAGYCSQTRTFWDQLVYIKIHSKQPATKRIVERLGRKQRDQNQRFKRSDS